MITKRDGQGIVCEFFESSQQIKEFCGKIDEGSLLVVQLVQDVWHLHSVTDQPEDAQEYADSQPAHTVRAYDHQYNLRIAN